MAHKCGFRAFVRFVSPAPKRGAVVLHFGAAAIDFRVGVWLHDDPEYRKVKNSDRETGRE